MDHETFRNRILTYCRRSGQTLQQMARELSLHPKVLSRKLHGRAGAILTQPEVRRIIQTLAVWQAISSRAEAEELLMIAGLPSSTWSDAEWNKPPLDRLMLPAAPAVVHASSYGRSVTADLRPRHNLPASMTRLIGRAATVEQVQAVLRKPDTRLLTLIGPGGTGKTRLALAVAMSLLDAWADGVWFVALADVRDPFLVPRAIAQSLALPERPGEAHMTTLARYLHAKTMLLVLDNFEQVLDAGPTLGELLASAPGLTVLVTSRAVLHVYGERQWEVPPLDMPDPRQPLAANDLSRYAAIQLFVERAQAVQHEFELRGDNVAAVVEICARLDGLPLAIELAAASVKLLPPALIADQLRSRLTLLRDGPRDLPRRHQTLRHTLQWSYNLLGPQEQALLCRLAVFVGGWTLDAVVAIGGGDDVVVWDGIQSLIDQSLVRCQHEAAGDRWTMLETIREYAAEQLALSGEEEATRWRHAAYYGNLAEVGGRALSGRDKGVWLLRLEQEHDNLRAALDWAVRHDDEDHARERVEIGLRLAGAAWRFWQIRGHFAEGRAWLDRLLAIAMAQGTPADIQARAMIGAAWLAHSQDDFSRARGLLEATLALPGQAGGLVDLLVNMAMEARAVGDYHRATVLLEDSVAQCRHRDDRTSIGGGGLGLSLARLALVCGEQSRYERAIALWEECLVLHQEIGDPGGIAVSLLGLGDVARDLGDVARVKQCCGESLRLFRELGEQWGVGFSLNNLALAACYAKNLPLAYARAKEALALFHDMNAGSGVAEVLATVAYIGVARGALAEARSRLDESLRQARVTGPRWLVAANLEVLAMLEAKEEHWAQVPRLLGAAQSIRAAIGVPVPPARASDLESVVAQAQVNLGVSRFEAERAAVLSIEQAIEYPGVDGVRVLTT